MLFLLYTVHVVVCIFLILVVLLQQGKGADLSVFGGGGTMTAFGARGAATLLHKLTVTSFVLFILTTIGIGIAQGFAAKSTVMSVVPAEGEAAVAAPAELSDEAEEAPPAALPAEDGAADEGASEDAMVAADDEGGDGAVEAAAEDGENDDAGGGQ